MIPIAKFDASMELKGSWFVGDDKSSKIVKLELIHTDPFVFVILKDQQLVIYLAKEDEPNLIPYLSFNGFVDYFSVSEILVDSTRIKII